MQTVVAAAGNIDHDRLLGTLQRDRLGTGSARGRAARLASPPAVPGAPHRRHVEREGAQTHVVFGSPAVAHSDSRRYTLALISTLLGGGMSSRLFQRVREELGLAYAVYSFQTFHADTGTHGVYVGTAPETASEAVAAITEELDRVAGEGLPAAEVEAGKNQLKGQVTLSLESVTARMYRAAAVELYGEPYRSLDEELAAIERVDHDDVHAVCREFFAPERQTIVTLGPTTSGLTSTFTDLP